MKKILPLVAALAATTLAGPAVAADAKIGIHLGFTGPIESLSPNMAGGAEMAIDEINASGNFMGGGTITAVRADSTCVDAAAATASAERLVTSDRVNAIMGSDCSGVTTATLQNVAMPNGIMMISPSATSPGLTTLPDNGLFFRTAPSDARQGEVIADTLADRGFKTVAITYTNNDYGQGLADSIEANIKKTGGTVTITASHEDGKADYSAEVSALAQAGGDILVVAGYLDQGGKGIIQGALDTGAFDVFYLPDGMLGQSILDAIGSDLNGSIAGAAGSDSDGANTFKALAGNYKGIEGEIGPFVAESYDAAALIALAMQAANTTDSQIFKGKIFDVANAPGVKIGPGELGRALELLSQGQDIDYQGASDVEFIRPGEAAGSFAEYEIRNGKFETVRYR